MSEQNPREIVQEILQDGRIAVLTYTDAQGRLVSTPMGMQKVEDPGTLWFLTGLDTDKVRAIEANPQVNVSLQTDSGWLSYSGRAEAVRDEAKLDELWDASASMFMESDKDDPRSGLIRVDGQTAEYWTNEGKLTTALEFAKSVLGSSTDKGDGKGADLGRNEVVDL